MNTRVSLALRLTGAALLAAVAPLMAADPADVKKLKDTRECVGCSLQNAELPGQNLAGANLKGADLSGANLYSVDLANAKLTDAKLAGSDLRGANLRGARGAALAGTITNERTTCPDGQSGPCQ